MMYTISELAKEFGLTARMLCYYEELGVLRQKRETGFMKRGIRPFENHHARQKIRVFLVLLFEKDRTGVKQLEKTIESAEKKLQEINERIRELDELKQELESMIDGLSQNLYSLKPNP